MSRPASPSLPPSGASPRTLFTTARSGSASSRSGAEADELEAHSARLTSTSTSFALSSTPTCAAPGVAESGARISPTPARLVAANPRRASRRSSFLLFPSSSADAVPTAARRLSSPRAQRSRMPTGVRPSLLQPFVFAADFPLAEINSIAVYK